MEVRVITLRKRAPDANNIQVFSDIALQLIETIETNSYQPDILRNETLSGNDSVPEDQNIDPLQSIFSNYKFNELTTDHTSTLKNVNLDRLQSKIYDIPPNISENFKERNLLNIPSDNLSGNEYRANPLLACEILKNNKPISKENPDIDSLFTNIEISFSSRNIKNKKKNLLGISNEVKNSTLNFLPTKFDNFQSRDARINLDENENSVLKFDNSNTNYFDSSNTFDDEPNEIGKSSTSYQNDGLETPSYNLENKNYEFVSQFPKNQLINMDDTALDIFETSMAQSTKNNRLLVNKQSKNHRRHNDLKSVDFKNEPHKIVPKYISDIDKHNIPCKIKTTIRLNKDKLFMDNFTKNTKSFEFNPFRKPLPRIQNRITNYFKKITATETGTKSAGTARCRSGILNNTSGRTKSGDISYSVIESVTPIPDNTYQLKNIRVSVTSDKEKSSKSSYHNDVSGNGALDETKLAQSSNFISAHDILDGSKSYYHKDISIFDTLDGTISAQSSYHKSASVNAIVDRSIPSCHKGNNVNNTKKIFVKDQLNLKSKNSLTVNNNETECCLQFNQTYCNPNSIEINSVESVILQDMPITIEQNMNSKDFFGQEQKCQSMSTFKMKLERFKEVNQTKIEDIFGVTKKNFDLETLQLTDQISENTDQKKHKGVNNDAKKETDNETKTANSNNMNPNKLNIDSKMEFSNYSINSECINENKNLDGHISNDKNCGNMKDKENVISKRDQIAYNMIRHEDLPIELLDVQFENYKNIDKSLLSAVDLDNKENKLNIECNNSGKHQHQECEIIDKLIEDRGYEMFQKFAYDEENSLKFVSENQEAGTIEKVTNLLDTSINVKKIHTKSSITTDKSIKELTDIVSSDCVNKSLNNKREDSVNSLNFTEFNKPKVASERKHDDIVLESLTKTDEATTALKRRRDAGGPSRIIGFVEGNAVSKKKRNNNGGSSISTECDKVNRGQKLNRNNLNSSNLNKSDKMEKKHNDNSSLTSLIISNKPETGLNKVPIDDCCLLSLTKSDDVSADEVADKKIASQPLSQTKKRNKFFAPLKSQSEVKHELKAYSNFHSEQDEFDVQQGGVDSYEKKLAESLKIWNGIQLDRSNMTLVKDSLNSAKIHEIGFTITYKEGFCGLNKPLEENTLRKGCTPNGLLFKVIRGLSITDHYFFKFDSCSISSSVEKRFFEFLLGLDCKKVCFDTQSFLLLLLDVLKFEERRVCYIWDMMDPLVASWLINPDSPLNSFDQLASALKTMVREINEDLMTFYCQLLTLQSSVMSQLVKKLVELSLYDIYISIEIKITPILAVMEASSLVIDKNRLTEFGRVLNVAMRKLEKEADLAAGRPIKLSSTVDLRTVLYDELKLDQHSGITVGLTYAGKHKSTDQATLKLLEDYHPLPGIVLQYRQFQKIKSTYVDGFIQFIKRNSTISTTWDQCSAATGRISSNNPNLQAIPKKSFQIPQSPDEVNLRSCFKAREGYTLIGADFHQIELRLFAHLAADETLIRAFNKSNDIFTTLTQMRLAGDTVEVDKEERERTKTLVYAQMYGASTQKVAHILNLDINQATHIANKIFDMLPSLKGFSDRVIKECRREGKLKTLGGRLRLFPSINSSDFAARAYSERQAVNFLIQGSAADICKEAMIRTEHHLKMVNLQTELLLQIHDELVWQVLDSQVDKVIGLVKECMEDNSVCWSNRTNLRVPLTVQIKQGLTWDQLN